MGNIRDRMLQARLALVGRLLYYFVKTCKTLGFMIIIVCKNPAGGGPKSYLSRDLKPFMFN